MIEKGGQVPPPGPSGDRSAPAPKFTHKEFLMTRLEKLKELEDFLRSNMKHCDTKTLPGMAKQYRETLKEIEEIEETEDNDDDIAELLAQRDADGKAGAVR